MFLVRFAQFRPPLLALKPLFFQVPQQEEEPLFWGRSWLFRELVSHLLPERSGEPASRRGVIINGTPGSGKTAVLLQLVEYSCFGRSRPAQPIAATCKPENMYENPYSRNTEDCTYGRSVSTADAIQPLASRLVAYHFCQV